MSDLPPSPAGRPRRTVKALRILPVVAAVGVVLVLFAQGYGDVVLFYTTNTQASGSRSPLRFVSGANYASDNAEGFVSVVYPTAQQVSLSATVRGANGAYGSYLLDVVELQAMANTTAGWHLRLDVTRALSASGVNAAYLFDCTSAPTGVPDTGVVLSNGTDASGDPWAVYTPTCPGTQGTLSLLSTGSGLSIAIPKLVFGAVLLYLSFALDVASGGATTTVSATVVLSASSP